jgi:hypothetical protein
MEECRAKCPEFPPSSSSLQSPRDSVVTANTNGKLYYVSFLNSGLEKDALVLCVRERERVVYIKWVARKNNVSVTKSIY